MKNRHNDYPKILVICAAGINKSTATGITMVNLFMGWPLNKIAQIYDDALAPVPDVCTRFWRVSSHDVPLVGKFKTILKQLRPLKPLASQDADNPSLVKRTVSGSLTHGVATAWGDIVPLSFSEELWQWIDDFKPDIIYSVLGSIRVMRIALQVSKKYTIPIIPHFMDDWPATIYKESPMHIIPRYILLRTLNKILKRSSTGMTISDDMAIEYSQRYGIKFTSFMNCVELESEEFQPTANAAKISVTFGYIGGLHLNRWRSLLQIGAALQKLSIAGHAVELVVFAPQRDIERYGHLFKDSTPIRIGGSLAPELIIDRLKEFDVLVHIESFKECDRLYTRLSISTKIPQYMSVGLPIFAYGPDSLSSVNYIRETGCGLVVTEENNLSLLSEVLEKLATSPDLRCQLGSKGFETARLHHNAAIERKHFRMLLTENANCLSR